MWLLLMATLPESTERMRQTLGWGGGEETDRDKVRCMVTFSKSAVVLRYLSSSLPVFLRDYGICDGKMKTLPLFFLPTVLQTINEALPLFVARLSV